MANFAILCVLKGVRMELVADKVALVRVYQGLLAVCVTNVPAENTVNAARTHAQMVAFWVSATNLMGFAHAKQVLSVLNATHVSMVCTALTVFIVALEAAVMEYATVSVGTASA